MVSNETNYSYLLESLISIFTVKKGKIQILLIRKKVEPYRGYWILPGGLVQKTETIEDNLRNSVYDKTGIPSLYFEQCHVFSDIDRDPNNRIIATTFIGLIDNTTLTIKKEDRDNIESGWFPITDLPKIGYDHEQIIRKGIDFLSKKIVSTNILQSLFPCDFTLPEIQKVYEQILNKTFDRRNFRKKFITMNLIEDTGYNTEGLTGRPAKLYRFKEDIKPSNIF